MAVQPHGYRLLHKIPRLPELVADHVVERFAHLQKIMRAGVPDLVEVEGVGEARARAIKDGLARLAETLDPRTLRLAPMAALVEGPSRPRSNASRFAVTAACRSTRSTPGPTACPTAGSSLHPDVMGIRPLFDDLCRRLATHGFAVARPSRSPTSTTATTSTPPARMGRVEGPRGRGADREPRARRRLARRPRRREEVAVLGFCMGGMYALKAAATGRFDRAVAFYGMIRVPEGWQGPDRREPLDMRADVVPDPGDLRLRGPLDPGRRTSTRCATRGRDRADCEVVVYEGADHGFVHDADRPAHRADDAADAWSRVLRVPRRASRAADAATEDSRSRGSPGARALRDRGCDSGSGR